MTFAEKVLRFYQNLRITAPLPEDVVVLDPYSDDVSFSYCAQFYRKFYGDNAERTIILGINPGRHGGGITGIPFTDPLKRNILRISNHLRRAGAFCGFYYNMINSSADRTTFMAILFSAISPLGFTKEERT